MNPEIKQGTPRKSGRGGVRLGPDGKPLQGRKKKPHVAPSVLSEIDKRAALSESPPDEIEGLAQRHARTALEALVKLLLHGTSETTKVTAANEVLDRGYGKPSVDVGGDPTLPFLGIAPARAVAKEIREEARRYAHLAIETLRKIAQDGASESARALASKALLNRGVGTVATAKMPDELVRPAAGKKEEAKRAAEAAASGRFETPSPPRRSLVQ